MAGDYVAVVVAVVGVMGTLGGTVLTQRTSLRDKRLEIEARRDDAETARQLANDERADQYKREHLAERTKLYADLNSAARTYRSRCQDHAINLSRAENTPAEHQQNLPETIEQARAAYRDLYARAQMILDDRTLQVASTVNLCLSHSYSSLRRSVDALRGLPEPTPEQRNTLTEHVRDWLQGPASDAVWLLRHALREELGTAPEFAQRDTYLQALAAAHAARHEDASHPYRDYLARAGVNEPEPTSRE